MKKRFLLLLIFIIFVISLITFFLILNYLDPYEYKVVAISSISFTFVLGVSTFLTLLLYFIKKIYYRGRVYVYHVLTSFRQGFFVSLFFVGMIFFNILGATPILTGFLLFILFIFLELFIQNLEK
ncbi:MAG: hypothetical protein PHS49_03675 [Candidatus Gracilibacteria bacterium]|nr:hypothetical protein [Candidatus Gracilibacteria bacterium]